MKKAVLYTKEKKSGDENTIETANFELPAR